MLMALNLAACAAGTPAETTASTEAATEATEAPAIVYPTEPDGSIKKGRVPNVVGRDAEFAQLDMKAAGFVQITVETVSDSAPAGTVIGQNLEAYITLPVDTAVIIYVTDGTGAEN